MCAIIGSNNLSLFETLYEVNLPRGNFASGVILLYNDRQETIKKQGSFNFEKQTLPNDANYYIGHVQAPTSAKRKWAYDTSHPFCGLNWAILHNGVLTNDKELKEYVPWDENPVDSSRILSLLQMHCESKPIYDINTQIKVITDVLSMLEGTFALCILNKDTNDVYLARQGSVLHYNSKGCFSTLKGKGYKLLEEGILLRKTPKMWRKVGTFSTSSPFIFV